jgi:hypothetical protein
MRHTIAGAAGGRVQDLVLGRLLAEVDVRGNLSAAEVDGLKPALTICAACPPVIAPSAANVCSIRTEPRNRMTSAAV